MEIEWYEIEALFEFLTSLYLHSLYRGCPLLMELLTRRAGIHLASCVTLKQVKYFRVYTLSLELMGVTVGYMPVNFISKKSVFSSTEVGLIIL
jgi:hypothetical protein